MKILISMHELIGIVLFRFRRLPRVWTILLMLINIASVFFMDTIYGKAAFLAMLLGVAIMIIIYSKLGFVRLLGIGHILWVPMIVWILINKPFLSENSSLSIWLICLVTVNCISLIIDSIDVYRFLQGERKPYYHCD